MQRTKPTSYRAKRRCKIIVGRKCSAHFSKVRSNVRRGRGDTKLGECLREFSDCIRRRAHALQQPVFFQFALERVTQRAPSQKRPLTIASGNDLRVVLVLDEVQEALIALGLFF